MPTDLAKMPMNAHFFLLHHSVAIGLQLQFQGRHFVKHYFCLSFEKGSTLKGKHLLKEKNLLVVGANSFL